MIRLLSSELLRFRSRRLVMVIVALTLVGLAVGMVIAGATSHKPTQEQLDEGQQRYDRRIARCVEREAFGEDRAGVTVEELCREFMGSPSDWVRSGSFLRLSDLPNAIQAVSFILILIGLVIGASAIGASWQSGTITTILTWEPRRLRWLTSRFLVVAVCIFILALALLAVFSAAFALVTALRGTTATPVGFFSDAFQGAVRVAAVAAGASVLGAALATIGRNTAAALGAVFVYLAVLENLIRGLRPPLGRFMLGDSLATIITAEPIEYFDSNGLITVTTPTRGVVTTALYLGVLFAIAAVLMRRRDVN